MDVKEFYRRLRDVNYFTPIEDQLRDLFRIIRFSDLRASGIGIIPGTIPDTIRLQLTRRFNKRGKLVFFDNANVEELAQYRDYAVFLVDTLMLGEHSIDFKKYFSVIWAECSRNPDRLKRRFPQWKVVKGFIRYGRREYFLHGVMRIPAYSEHLALFIANPKDTWREWVDSKGITHYTNILANIVTKYRHGTKWGGKTIINNIEATPLFLFVVSF